MEEVDLDEVRLNQLMQNEEFRQDFLRNPILALRHEGLILAPEIENAIIESSRNIWSWPKYFQGSILLKEGVFDPTISLEPGK